MNVRTVSIFMKRSQNNSHLCNLERWQGALELAASNGWDSDKDLLDWRKQPELTREEAVALADAIGRGKDGHPDQTYLEGLISWLGGLSNRQGFIVRIDPPVWS